MAPPRKYQPHFNELARNAAILGSSDTALAEALQVAPSQIQVWRKQHEGFAQAQIEGREIADGQVAASLVRKATGYERLEYKLDKHGKRVPTGKIVYHPPDTIAIMYFLNNRRPDLWRASVSHDHQHRHDHQVQFGLDLWGSGGKRKSAASQAEQLMIMPGEPLAAVRQTSNVGLMSADADSPAIIDAAPLEELDGARWDSENGLAQPAPAPLGVAAKKRGRPRRI
jgi:hypothetical protein